MKILVVGLGYVGGPLAASLAARGHELIGVRRSDAAAPPGVRLVRGDVTDGAFLESLPRDVDLILALLSAGQRSEAAYERTYVGGAQRLRAAFPSVRLVWVSSTAVYAGDSDSVVDDDTPAHVESGTGAVLLRAEAAVAVGPHLIVRPSGIYGPERTTLLGRLTRGELTTAELDVWTNRIHRDDLVSILSFCAERPHLAGTLLATDQEPAQLGAMQDWVQSELARQSKLPISVGAGALPASRVAASRPGASRSSRRILATRLAALGFEWRHPSYRDGYRPLLNPSYES